LGKDGDQRGWMHKAATVISIIIYDTFTSEYLGMLFTHSDWLTQRCPAKYYMYNSFWIEFRAKKKIEFQLAVRTSSSQ